MVTRKIFCVSKEAEQSSALFHTPSKEYNGTPFSMPRKNTSIVISPLQTEICTLNFGDYTLINALISKR
jgi:hypothetical protein